jgi:hypothetical protein
MARRCGSMLLFWCFAGCGLLPEFQRKNSCSRIRVIRWAVSRASSNHETPASRAWRGYPAAVAAAAEGTCRLNAGSNTDRCRCC